jgi:hypothetical protein
MLEATLVTVHGFWSNPATWDRLCTVWQADDELKDLRVHGFAYPSPKKPLLPLSGTRVPDFDDVAQTLATEYVTVLANASNIAFVTHSQGGLVLQRFLAWMVNEGRARELARIRTVVMLACPNGGSQYLDSIRRVLGYGRHPQAGDLVVLNKRVADTQRTVLDRIVYASAVDDHECRIPFHVYAADSDAVVPAASAQAGFPGAGTVAGNHFTILDPAAPRNRTAAVVRHHILTNLAERSPAFANGFGPAVPARPSERGKPEGSLSRAQGVQVGNHNIQYNVVSSLPVADGVPHTLPSDHAAPPAVGDPGVSSPEGAEDSARRVTQESKRMVRGQSAGFRVSADSSAIRRDQVEALVESRDGGPHPVPPTAPPLAEDGQVVPERAIGQPDPWPLLVNQLLSRLDLGNWDDHVGGLLRASTGMHSSSKSRMLRLAIWLNGRILPNGQPELRRILLTLQKVIADLVNTFELHCEEVNPEQDDPWLRTAKFYKTGGWRPSRSAESELYEAHIDLLSDLALELTRVVNWLCDFVRREFDPVFRFEQGAIQLNGGPYPDADDKWFRTEYSQDEMAEPSGPYESLEDFLTRRFSRDVHTGHHA